MSAPFGDPRYDPDTWSLGYQMRQSGVAGPSVLAALATPPADMVTAAEDGYLALPEEEDPVPEPMPPYN